MKSGFDNVTHLIFDEAHEREINTDLLLVYIRDAVAEYPCLKVIGLIEFYHSKFKTIQLRQNQLR